MKTKTVILLLLFLIYICAQDQLKNENIQNQSTENKNQHEPQTDRPFIFTYDMEEYDASEYFNQKNIKTRQIIEKVLKVVQKFLADLLRVEVKTVDFDDNNGLVGSDLHIHFDLSKGFRGSDKLLSNQKFLSYYTKREKDNIPTHLKIVVNNFSRDFDFYDDEISNNAIQNEIIQAILLTYIKTINIEENPELDTIEYVSSNLKEMAVQHFNCDKLIGFPVIIRRGPSYHLKSKPFENEISGYMQNKKQQPYLSKFTIALLKSTNMFTYVNESMTEEYTHGKDAGCQIFEGKYQVEEEKPNLRSRDDIYSKPKIQFAIDQLSDFRIEQFEDYIVDVVQTKGSIFKQSVLYKCDHESNQLYVQLSNWNYDICSYNNQTFQYDYDQKNNSYQMFLCPENIKEFCSFKKQCANTYCSQNGYCNNGVCNCIPNYSGDGCEIYTPPIDNTPPIENENESGQENTEQPSDP